MEIVGGGDDREKKTYETHQREGGNTPAAALPGLRRVDAAGNQKSQ